MSFPVSGSGITPATSAASSAPITPPSSSPPSSSLPPAYLLDANILLRLIELKHPHHDTARNAVRELLRRGVDLVTVPQSLYESWSVATRPSTARSGLGLTPTQVERALSVWERNYPVRDDTAEVRIQWRRLVTTYGVSGKEAHDARLVAAMKAHELTHLLTFNGSNFTRYTTGEGITVVDPHSVTATIAAIIAKDRQP